MRTLGVLLLAAGGGLYYLVAVDRVSPTALQVVESLGAAGGMLARLLGLLGLILVVAPWFRGRGKARGGPVVVESRRVAINPAFLGKNWVAALRQAASGLLLESGATVIIDPARVPQIRLNLLRQTPERSRRSVEVFADFLVSVPPPPRVAIRYEDCPHAGPPRRHQVTAVLRRTLVGLAFTVVEQQDTLEIVFSAPDPRWRGN